VKTNKKIFEPYIKLASFFAKIYGPRCEVLLHDLEDLDHTIVAIENSHVTGRKVGGKITDFGLNLLLDEKWRDRDYIVNYEGRSLVDDKPLRTSTFFIRDEKNRVVGLMVVNVDISEFVALKAIVDREVTMSEDMLSNTFENEVTENFLRSLEEIKQTMFQKALEKTELDKAFHAGALGTEEKKQVMASLYQMNYFNLKGAVAETAAMLDISAPTIYRYLRAIQSENE
jgi:predicted transcriptional regulator YheO